MAIANEIVYIFVDEAGDMDFSPKGSRHYMFSFLVKRRPFRLHEVIATYRYELLERNLDPAVDKQIDIEAFHAHKDNRHIKEQLFSLIERFDPEQVKTYSYILEKPKVLPDKRQEKSIFYIDNLTYAIAKLLDKLQIEQDFIIITDRLPVKQNKNAQIKALKKGIKSYLRTTGKRYRYGIYHHCSASSTNLQIIDYINWAIFRKYEHGDDSYYKRVSKYLLDEEVVTKGRAVNHY